MCLLYAFLSNNDHRNMLISLIMSTFLFVSVAFAFVVYLIIFLKKSFKEKFVNKKVIYCVSSVLILNLPIIILGYVFGFVINTTTRRDMFILIFLSFILTFLVGMFLFLFLHVIVIGIGENEIFFLGEKISIGNITNVSKDERLNRLVIFYYLENTYSTKKCKYSLTSKAGKFMLDNLSLLDKNIVINYEKP